VKEGGGSSRRWRLMIRVAAAIVVTGWLLRVGYQMVYPYPAGVEQPLPFSHRVHSGEREINCLFCHDGADRSKNAGMPEVSKCLLCHSVIIPQLEPVRKLHEYYQRKQPIPWRRIYHLPDFTHFSHEMHLAGGVDCGECHGNVKEMDRVVQATPMEMGFCVDCHRKNDASVDCLLCHY